MNTLSDQEEAAAQLSKYDFLALPVVDLEERLVGIITVDDAMDVIQEENTPQEIFSNPKSPRLQEFLSKVL